MFIISFESMINQLSSFIRFQKFMAKFQIIFERYNFFRQVNYLIKFILEFCLKLDFYFILEFIQTFMKELVTFLLFIIYQRNLFFNRLNFSIKIFKFFTRILSWWFQVYFFVLVYQVYIYFFLRLNLILFEVQLRIINVMVYFLKLLNELFLKLFLISLLFNF